MKKSPKKYTDEFKRDALRLLKSSGKTKSEVERELGLSHGLLRQWGKRFAINEIENKLELSDQAQLESQIKQLKRENAILQEERDILKKTISIFSRERHK